MPKRKLIIFAVLILLIFSLNIFQQQVRGFFYSFSHPIQKKLWGAGDNIADFFLGIFKKDALLIENRELRTENQKLLLELSELETLKEENAELRKALDIGLPEDFQLALARVIARDVSQDLILIDRGSADGLREDMAIITEEKVLLGRIIEVNENSAKVSLISHQDSSFDVEVLGKDAEGLIVGQGGQNIQLDFVARDKVIEEDDVVISSSLGGLYPRGLLVGLIKEVQKDDVEPFQQAEVTPFFRLRQLKSVFIILK